MVIRSFRGRGLSWGAKKSGRVLSSRVWTDVLTEKGPVGSGRINAVAVVARNGRVLKIFIMAYLVVI